MNTHLYLLRTLLEMNWKEFSRDRAAAFFSFGFPLMFLFLFGFTSSYRSAVRLGVGVVNSDTGRESQTFVAALKSKPSFRVLAMDETRGLSELRNNKLSALIVIPAGYSVTERSSSSMRVLTGAGQLDWVKLGVDASLADARLDVSGQSAPPRYTINQIGKSVSDFSYIFPGLLALSLLNLGLFATANPLLRARDRGTLKHLSVTPVSVWMVLAGQITLRFGIAVVQVITLFLAAYLLFGVRSVGSTWLLCCLLFVGSIMFIAMGYAIAGSAPSQQTGSFIVLLVDFALMFLGQVFVDLTGVPGLSSIVKLIPLTYLTDGCRQLVLGTPGLFSLKIDFTMLIVWTIFLLVAAARIFRFDMEVR